ncbi:hypothetical protein JCM10213_005593 [Rhodosporidiobolus nylandii]
MPTTLRPRGRRPPPQAAKIGQKGCSGARTIEALYDGLASSFASFGRLLANHQSAALLLTALVICSLLSPAILLTFSPAGAPLNLSASAINRRGRGEFVWELDGLVRQGLISTEEEVCWDRVTAYYAKTGRDGGGRRMRAEQVLVSVAGPRGTAGSRGKIGKGVLHRAWRVQKELERRLLRGEVRGNRCLAVEGRCLALSPLGWWRSEDELLQDEDVHRTLSLPPPPSALQRAAPLTISEAFVGVGRDRQGTVKYAQHLVLTFFLEDDPAVSPSVPGSPLSFNASRAGDLARKDAKAAWRAAVRDVVDRKGWEGVSADAMGVSADPMGVTSESRLPSRHVLLKFLPHLTVDAHPRLLENVIYGTGYALVLFYVARYIRRLRAHSKMGLLITGIVELTASGIMSVSICWLMGWSLGLVPWNLLAFLVLTSGLDNMILVLRAIVAGTDVNLPVPQRMSAGLKSVGVEMTILLLVEEFMAGALLLFVEIDVMRQWIRFGAVVLVVDYFLELTFFSTVLSIDIQRLELADLLVQNSAPYQAVPVSPEAEKAAALAAPCGRTVGSMVKSAWRVLRDRPAKTSTVAFLWFINLFLWAFYGSEHYLPAACSQTALSSDRPFLSPSLSPAISRSLRLGQVSDPASSSHLDVSVGAGAALWKLINPLNATSVQVYLEPPVSIQFFDEEALAAPESIDLFHSVTTEAAPSFTKKAALVLLPIAVVMFLLYLLLLYLLKDKELLDAHHGSGERLGGPDGRRRKQDEVQKGPTAGVELLKGLKARHRGDVELAASGGNVIASWAGLEEKVQVQVQASGGGTSASFTLDIPLAAEPPSLTGLVVGGRGEYCAAATTKGRLLVWSLKRGGSLVDLGASRTPASSIVSLLASPRDEARLAVEEPTLGAPAPPSSATSETKPDKPPAAFWTLHRDGTIIRWDCELCRAVPVETSASPAPISADDSPTRRWLLAGVEPEDAPLLATSYNTGRLVLVSLEGEHEVRFDGVVVAPGQQITAVVLGVVPLLDPVDPQPTLQSVVVVGSSSGAVNLHTLADPSRRITTLANLGSPVRQIRLVPSPSGSYCPTCNESVTDGLTLLASTRSTMRVFRLFTPPTPSSVEPCTCNTADPTLVSRSRSSSSGLLSSPIMSRTLSGGGSGRRFSPRKKPATPARPAQLPPSSLGDSPIRPRALSRSANGSHDSQSSSGTSSPTERGSPAVAPSPSPPPPPLSTSSSTFFLASAEISPPPATIPLPPPALVDPLTPPEAPSAFPHLRAVELATVAIDERSGWEVLDGKIGGLRRARRNNGGRSWEVWTVGLGKNGGSFQEGYQEGSTGLAALLSAAEERLDEDGVTPTPAPVAAAPALRRRNLPSASSVTHSLVSKTALGASSSNPAVRFTAESVDLPFSQARPLVTALSGTGLAVGLGNQLVVMQRAEAGGLSMQHGFLGL